jgi:hypothetical protein
MTLSPGISASQITRYLGGDISPEVDISLVYDGIATSFSIDPGEEAEDRLLLIIFLMGRNGAGSITNTTITIDGVTKTGGLWRSTGSQMAGGVFAILHPVGTDSIPISINPITGKNVSVQAYRIVGGAIRSANVFDVQTVSSADPYGWPIAWDGAPDVPDRYLVAQSGLREMVPGNLFPDAWLEPTAPERTADVTVTNGVHNWRFQPAIGKVPLGVESWDSPQPVGSNQPAAATSAVVAVRKDGDLIINSRDHLMRTHFRADRGVFRDGSGTPCGNGDGVQVWTNHGSYGDNGTGDQPAAVQPTSARRPTFCTGGANGYPFLRCDRSQQQHFEDILVTPHTTDRNSAAPTTCVAVVRFADFAQTQPILGDARGYTRTTFRATTAGNITAIKSLHSVGPVPADQLMVVAVASYPSLSGWRHCIDGVYGTSGGGSSAFYSSTVVTTGQFLRTDTNSTPSYFHGDIYEFMQFDEQLLQYHMTQVVESLMLKYGIT